MPTENEKHIQSWLLENRKIQTIGNMLTKHLIGKGEMWSFYAVIAVYTMITFVSPIFSGFYAFALFFCANNQIYST